MKRNSTGIIPATVASAALALAAACGTAAPPAFHPAGETPSAAALGDPGQRGLLRFPFPSDVHFKFGSPLPSSPSRAAAVIADENFQLAYYYGIYSQGTDHRYRAYIADQRVLASVEETMAGQAAIHEGFTGTIRFYDISVARAPWAAELAVASCVDSSRLFDTDIRTGRLRPARPGAAGRDHFLESDILAKRGGRWRIVGTGVTYYPRGQAKECMP